MQTTSDDGLTGSSATATTPRSAGTSPPMPALADTGQPGPRAAGAGELLHLARENLRLLVALAARYEVEVRGADPDGREVRSPADLADYLGPEMAGLAQEQLRAVLLDGRNRILGVQLIYQGGQNAVNIRLADCFREAVRAGAAAILLVHNHPSGDPNPSPQDIALTGEAGRVGDLLGIPVIDHVVVGRAGFVSLRRRGLYEPPAGDRDPVAAGG